MKKHLAISLIAFIITAFLGCDMTGSGAPRTSSHISTRSNVYLSPEQAVPGIYEKASSFGSPIIVYQVDSSQPNTAGGVDANIMWQNIGEGTIKYLVFVVSFINRVDDKVSSQIGGQDTFRLRITGPIEPNNPNIRWLIPHNRIAGQEGWSGSVSTWKNVIYNNTAARVAIDAIEVEYMNGDKQSISGNKLFFAPSDVVVNIPD
jgi:hypothetical protein